MEHIPKCLWLRCCAGRCVIKYKCKDQTRALAKHPPPWDDCSCSDAAQIYQEVKYELEGRVSSSYCHPPRIFYYLFFTSDVRDGRRDTSVYLITCRVFQTFLPINQKIKISFSTLQRSLPPSSSKFLFKSLSVSACLASPACLRLHHYPEPHCVPPLFTRTLLGISLFIY